MLTRDGKKHASRNKFLLFDDGDENICQVRVRPLVNLGERERFPRMRCIRVLRQNPPPRATAKQSEMHYQNKKSNNLRGFVHSTVKKTTL